MKHTNNKTIEHYIENIGKKVCKKTCKNFREPKSFKSGGRVNTVMGVIEN